MADESVEASRFARRSVRGVVVSFPASKPLKLAVNALTTTPVYSYAIRLTPTLALP